MSAANPLVSICIPTYNGETWLLECLRSALSQTYANLEILVVDDCSTDGTVELARSLQDERLRIAVNESNQGLVGNWNACVRLARGEFIKFLFQDDVLYPNCVEKMLAMIERHSELGLVFSTRDIIVEKNVSGADAEAWLDYARCLHKRFDVHEGVNDGRALFLQHAEKKFAHCCVGEPTTVLIRKECFRRLGLFNPRVKQICDAEMWLRIMYFYDIGFIDERLCAFRYHAASATSANHRKRNYIYDPFWLLEGLLSHEEIRHERPEIVRMRDDQLARNSLLRPSNGWRSLGHREGRREALMEALRIPQRTRFLVSHLAQSLRRRLKAASLRDDPLGEIGKVGSRDKAEWSIDDRR